MYVKEMTEFNSPYIFYLQPADFDSEYNLIIREDIPNRISQPLFSGITIIMIQGNFCGYCTKAKPVYQRIAEEVKAADFTTIKIDGEDNKYFFQQHLDDIIRGEIRGVPTFVKMYQGKAVDIHKGDISYESLVNWIYGEN